MTGPDGKPTDDDADSASKSRGGSRPATGCSRSDDAVRHGRRSAYGAPMSDVGEP